MKKKWIWIAPLAILAIPLFIAIGGELVMHLWNWLLPPLFGLHMITFWQALGLVLLCRILFGSWGSGGGKNKGRRRREKWEQMTPEEREKFRQGMRGRCGFGEPASESKA